MSVLEFSAPPWAAWLPLERPPAGMQLSILPHRWPTCYCMLNPCSDWLIFLLHLLLLLVSEPIHPISYCKLDKPNIRNKERDKEPVSWLSLASFMCIQLLCFSALMGCGINRNKVNEANKSEGCEHHIINTVGGLVSIVVCQHH